MANMFYIQCLKIRGTNGRAYLWRISFFREVDPLPQPAKTFDI